MTCNSQFELSLCIRYIQQTDELYTEDPHSVGVRILKMYTIFVVSSCQVGAPSLIGVFVFSVSEEEKQTDKKNDL